MDKEKLGLIHIYCGDGKGKTTASLGLAIRSAGAGFKVFILQFLKNWNTSELKKIHIGQRGGNRNPTLFVIISLVVTFRME